MLSEEVLARTFSPPSYTDAYESVADYRRVMAWSNQHPESGSAAAASALDLPRGRIRPWLDGAKPDAVRAIETAEELEWFDATPTNASGCAFLLLAAGVFSGGSVAVGYQPRFTIGDERAASRIEAALTVVGCGSRRVHVESTERATEVEPAVHPSLLGRVLVALGVPLGAKVGNEMSLPRELADAPLSVRAAFAELYLLNRAVGRESGDLVMVQEEGRPESYRRELAEFFEALSGGSVTLAGENALTVGGRASRALGFGRDGPYRRDGG